MNHPDDPEATGPLPPLPDPRHGDASAARESISLPLSAEGAGEAPRPRILRNGDAGQAAPRPSSPAEATPPPAAAPGPDPVSGVHPLPPLDEESQAATAAPFPAAAPETRPAAPAPPNMQPESGDADLPPSADHLFEEAAQPGPDPSPGAESSPPSTPQPESGAAGEAEADDLGLDLLDGLDAGTGSPMITPDAASSSSNPRHMLEAWLATMVEAEASDLILRAGGRPSYRVHGKISFLPGRVPDSGPLLEVLEGIVGPKRMEDWRETGSVDVALELDGLGRFRMNGYRQMGAPALVLRRVGNQAPALDSLNLPSAPLKKIVTRTRGLFLVTGIAGSGKSTTLAAMLQYLNATEERHIITLEDPVETLYTEERCVISQREVGTDCETFHDGLRHALRQSPDLILIGEMRDAETVSAALDATETGHMVVSTLHTVNAPQTLDRILGFFPAHQHKQVCLRLAENLAGVLSMRLLPTTRGDSRVPACELMTSTPQVRELLGEGKTTAISRVIEQGVEPGQVSFNQSLRRLVEKGLVELDVALGASDRPDELLMALRGITGGNSRRRQAQARGDGRLRMAGD